MNAGQALALIIAVGMIGFALGQTYERQQAVDYDRAREFDDLKRRLLELQRAAAVKPEA